MQGIFTFLLYFKNINHSIHIKKYQTDHFILLFHGNLFCISENFSGDGDDNRGDGGGYGDAGERGGD